MRTPAKRRRDLHLLNFDGGEKRGTFAHHLWIRGRPCVVCEKERIQQRTPTEACHVVARGHGGCNSHWSQLIPMCTRHHVQQGSWGILSFQKTYQIELGPIADALADEHLAQQGRTMDDLVEGLVAT